MQRFFCGNFHLPLHIRVFKRIYFLARKFGAIISSPSTFAEFYKRASCYSFALIFSCNRCGLNWKQLLVELRHTFKRFFSLPESRSVKLRIWRVWSTLFTTLLGGRRHKVVWHSWVLDGESFFVILSSHDHSRQEHLKEFSSICWTGHTMDLIHRLIHWYETYSVCFVITAQWKFPSHAFSVCVDTL